MPTNLSSFFLAAAMMLAAVPSAFAQETTFNVDMTCAPAFDNVFVTGPWCGWCFNDVYNTMTDPDGDGVYTVTLDETVTGIIEYKYAIDGFTGQEDLVNDMIEGASCAPITDYNAYANRQTPQGSTTNDNYGTCDGTCNDVPLTSVTFHVDMSGYEGSYDPSQVTWNGSANGWCGNCAPMEDPDGDGIYSLTLQLEGDSIEYKFAIGQWDDQEDLTPESSCTVTTYSDGAPNGCCYVNRVVSVVGEEPIDLPVVCWNSCEACGFVPTPGCIDVGACNYDAGATEDDGSCDYESCIDESVLFYESFANGFDGSNGNGAWTVSDNQDGRLWVWVAPDGQGFYPDGEATGSTHPGGAYSTNTGPLESTTAGNGWVIYDNDFWHGGEIDANNPAFDNEGTLTSPSMDFSNNGSVIVSWETYFRYCCSPYAPVYLEVGTTENGVTTWTTFDAHGDFIESANAASANPLSVSVDVSCVAAYQNSVQLRFAYRQAPETGQGYSHYYWGIDDVTVTSNIVANDLEIKQVTNGNVFSVWEYRLTPFEQAIDGAADGGLVAGVMYKNSGTDTQYNVDVLVEILDEDSMPIFTVTETIDTVHSFAQAPTCPANTQDTLYVQTGWEPDAPGDYSLRISLTNDNDATPLNNVLTKDFSYTEDVYGHDNEAVLDTTELGPRESEDIPGFYDPTGYGSYYHCPNPGSVAYGIAVTFGPNTGLTASGGVDPSFEFTTRLYTLDGSATITDSPFDEAYWVFNTPPNPTGDPNLETYLAFDDPIELGTWSSQTGGEFYFAGVISEFESAAQLTVLAEPNSDTDNSTGVYSQTGAGDFVWFTSQTSTPAVRLITGSFEAGCTDVMACNYDPIAEVSDGSCLFVGQNCSDGLVNTINDVVTENCQCEGEGAVYGCTNPLACNYGAEANVDDGSCCNCSGDSLSAGDLLYFENFDDYNVGDAISEVSQAFDLWPVAGATDAYVSDEAALSGTNSLKIEGQLTGGPMDVVLTAGLEGIQSVKFNVLVPIGSSGYYNVQENIVAAIDWAFECYLGSDGIITFAVDPVPDGSSGPELSTTYNYGDWVEINHVIDTDADLMNVFIDGSWVGELPYDGEQFGGVNFYAAGDGVTLPLYYVDDISVEIPGFLPGCNVGCTDTMACNYVPSAIADDGSCDYNCLGCTDAEAINYDPEATVDDGTCVYFATSCEFIGHPGWAGLEAGLYSDSTLWHYQGAEASGAWVLHMPELVVEPASGSMYAVMEWSNLTMSNMPPGLQPENMPSLMTGGEQVCVSYSGIPSEVGLYPVLVSGELTISLFGSPYVVGPYNVVGTIEVLPNPNPIAGCTYGNAANYVVYANVDDGSCVFAGCTEVDADNYQPLATVDDGTCVFGECEALCPADINGDGSVNTNDLLGLLGYFGLPCEE